MNTLTDDLIEVRDVLLAEKRRMGKRLRDCILSREPRVGRAGLPIAPFGVADLIFGGWTRYFMDFDPRTPEQKERGEGVNVGLPTGGR